MDLYLREPLILRSARYFFTAFSRAIVFYRYPQITNPSHLTPMLAHKFLTDHVIVCFEIINVLKTQGKEQITFVNLKHPHSFE